MKLTSKDIAEKYDLIHLGSERVVLGFGSIHAQSNNMLLWAKTSEFCKLVYNGVLIASYQDGGDTVQKEGVTYLLTSKSPRLMFARIVNDLFGNSSSDDFTNDVEKHRENKRIRIGENCFIAKGVTIGDGTEILHNSSIFSNTTIGKNCRISTGVSIGTSGLGFEYDGDEIIEFPQVGGVLIRNNVSIGPGTTVRRGALEITEIGEGCKIGSLCNIGHNCFVGNQSIFTTQVAMGGSSRTGQRCFLGMGSTIANKVTIGNRVTVGTGAAVVHNFPDDVTLVGIPAKILQK